MSKLTIPPRSRHRKILLLGAATPLRFKPVFLYILLSTLIGLVGCRKDTLQFIAYQPSVDDLNMTLAQVPAPSTHSIFDLDGLNQDTTLTTASGVRVTLIDTEQLFQNNAGTPIPCSTCPDLRIEVIEVLKKGDILARKLPTRTMDHQALETVAMVNVRVFCNEVELNLLPNRNYNIQVPAADLQPNLELWTGVLSGDELVGWNPSPSTGAVGWGEWQDDNGAIVTGYDILTKDLGWNSACAPITEPSSSFCIEMPPGFDSENSQVFLVLTNSKSVFELEADPNSNSFCLDQAPIGYSVQLITLTKLGNQYLLGNVQSEIGTNSVVDLDPEESPELAIIQFLKSL
ncbi:MAG: hypothetical protein R2792_11380 [Saprospiraceae bacterium]